MEFSKTTRVVMGFGLLAILLFVPLRIEIGYPVMYYAILVAMAIWGVFFFMNERKMDQWFLKSWAWRRRLPKVLIVLIEAVKSLIMMALILAFGQIVVNGNDFGDLVENLPLGVRIGIPAMLIAFSIVLGFVGLYEKNRRFDRLSIEVRSD